MELIVISSPSTDYTPDEINKLDKYFAQYKRAIVSIGAESPSLPEQQFLGEWGISYGKSILLDSQYKIGNDYSAVASSPLSTSTDTLLNGITSYIIAPYSRPLTTLWASSDRFNGRITTPLLTTSTQSYAKPFVEGETISALSSGKTVMCPALYTAVLTTQTTIVDNITVGAAFCSSLSPYVYNESLLNTNSYGNMTLMSNVLGEFNKSGVKVNIKNKSFAAPELAVIGNQLTVILVLLARYRRPYSLWAAWFGTGGKTANEKQIKTLVVMGIVAAVLGAWGILSLLMPKEEDPRQGKPISSRKTREIMPL